LTNYRADIDGLRAIAVSAVILFHAKVPFFSGGYVGVDVFFVISGYLIAGLIVSDLDRGRFSLVEFYTRRIRRIFPALYVVLAATALAGWAVLTPLDLKLLGESIFATATFSSNFLFWLSSGYFEPPLSQWPLLHTWSLSLEEQYYAVFPVLLLLLTSVIPRYRTALILLVTAVSLALCIFATGPDPRAAFFLAPFRVWEFLGGALLALGAVPQIKGRSARDIVGLIGLGLIAVSICLFTPETRFPGAAALLPVLGTAALIWAGEQRGTRCAAALSVPPLVLTGKMSYSLYLWHFPILAFASYVNLNGLGGGQTAILIALTVALSFLSWKFVEQPVRAKRWIFCDRLAVLGLAAFVTATAGAFGFSAYVKSGFPGRFDAATARVLAAELELTTAYQNCRFSLEQARAGDFCRIGAGSAAPSFVLWGDSHAESLRPGVALAANNQAATGLMASYGGCIPALGLERSDLGVCNPVNEAVLQHVLASPALKTIILAGRWALWTEGTRYKGERRRPTQIALSIVSQASRAPNRAAVEFGLDALVAKLKAAGKDVWLVGPVPEIGYPVPRALYLARLDRWLSQDIRPTFGEFRERQQATLDILKNLQSQYGAHLILPHEALCDASHCKIELDGAPLYADDDHLTVFGAEFIAPRFDPIFAR